MQAERTSQEKRLTPAKGAAVTSRITTGADNSLDQLEGSSILADGLVNLIALDAVVDRLGDRWPARREAIYDMVERVLTRRLGPNGYFVRVSETDFLVAQPDLGPFGAQACCIRSLGEILKHFLGAAMPQDIRVRQVSSIGGGEILASPIDQAAALHGDAKETRDAEVKARVLASAGGDDGLLSPERWSPFSDATGRKLRVSCKLEPVFELKHNTRIGYRLNRKVVDATSGEVLAAAEVERLSRANHLRIDMATISRGLARMQADEAGEQSLSLIIPVSYVTLSHQEGRQVLAQAFARARQAVLKGVLCEVCRIEGVPQVALLSAVSLIRPWSLFVIGNLAGPIPKAFPGMKEAGIQAVSFTAPEGLTDDGAFMMWLGESLKSTQKACKAAMVYGCSPRQLALAGLLGASHASVGAAETRRVPNAPATARPEPLFI